MAVETPLLASFADQLDRMVLHLRWSERGVLLVAGTSDGELEASLSEVLAERVGDAVQVRHFGFSATPVERLSLAHYLRALPPPDGRAALFVRGLDALSPEDRRTAIEALNLGRDRLAWAGYSVVLWVRSATIGDLMLKAPDFFSWRSGAYQFDVPADPAVRREALAALQRAPVETLETLRRRYLAWLMARLEWLDFSGIPQVRNIVRLRLEDIFVPLAATKEPVGNGGRSRETPPLSGGDEGRADLAGLAVREAAERRVGLAEALRDRRLVILGDPGSGKTTLLKHIALTLAQGRGGELGLGDAQSAPLPILFPVAAYASALRQRDCALAEHLADYFAERELPGLAPLFRDVLEGGRAIVLLDGLDEVQDPGERMRVARGVEDFVSRFAAPGEPREPGTRGHRVVVTSRIAGYEAARLKGLAHVTVLPFDNEDVARFARLWCLAYEQVTDASAAAERRARQRADGLVAAIRASEGVGRLAANPLLLTIIALIHYQNVRLPERRVELYRLAVEALAESWNRARSLAGESMDLHLRGRRLDIRFVINVLGPVAVWMHETWPGGLVGQRALEARLAKVLREREDVSETDARGVARAFLDLVRRGSGLLQERGLGLYGFMHLTFEEYLAARAIADLEADPTAILLRRWTDPRWREVILLAVGASPPAQATRLVEALLRAPAEGAARGKNVALAGQALADVGHDGVIGDVWQTTVGALVRLVGERDPGGLASTQTRVEAGDALGLLGDPRITDDAWVEVPAGEFLMGTAQADVEKVARRYGKHWTERARREVPQHRLHVAGFRIGTYPVTTQEFKRFVDVGGYDERGYWSEGGWEWRQRAGRTEPAYWQDPNLGMRRRNRPVVGVTWYEAEAYCNWLSRHLRDRGTLGPDEIVRLPTEVEWEKAARGADGRWWPWGNEWDGDKANADGEPGHATAVGLYPRGASPWGALDMAGNVWEWTWSLYKPYPYRPGDGREDPKAKGTRCLRGGAWSIYADYARSASRDVFAPDYAYDGVGFRWVVVSLASPR